MIPSENISALTQNSFCRCLKHASPVADMEGNVAESYVYDPAGNILSKTIDGKITTFTYDDANQLVSSTTDGKVTHYAYDAAGRLIKEGDKNYAYGWLDKVLSVTENGQQIASFNYHNDGQIAQAIRNGKSEDFLWDGLALIHRGETSFINEPFVTGGNPILSSKQGVMFNDMLGNTLGTKQEKFNPVSMTAFGETKDTDALFTGKPYIGELGYAFLFRNYRADKGKWLTADPLGYPDGWNNFAYCDNGFIETIDWLGAAARSITADGIKYTWDWATSKIGGFNWVEDFDGAKMGFEVNVTWIVTVYWECVRGNGCTETGSFTHSTVKNIQNIQWISHSAASGTEIPTFGSILEGIGVVAAEYISGSIPWAVDVGREDLNKLLVRPADNTILTNMKPINHTCKPE